MRPVRSVILLTFLIWTGTLGAQELPRVTSTMPSSQPAPKADPTTPVGTLLMFNRVTQTGDASEVRDLIQATTPQEKQFGEFIVDQAVAYANFRKAAAKAFGEEVAGQMTGITEADAAAVEQGIAQGVTKIDNDKATVEIKVPGAAAETEDLVKVDGKWKIPMASKLKDVTPVEFDQNMKLMRALMGAIGQTTQDMNDGKFKTPQEAQDAMRSKQATIMLEQRAAAAASPTSRPGQP